MTANTFNRRVIFFSVAVFAFAVYLAFKVVSLHFSDKIYLNEQEKEPPPRRGDIYDSTGVLLATSIEKYSLYANPSLIGNAAAAASAISPIIRIPANDVYSRLSRKKQFVWLKRRLSIEEYTALNALKIEGLGFRKEFARVYPHDELAGQLLGFTDIDGNGIEGIEYQYDEYLRGKYVPESCTINLTIDAYAQYIAESHLSARCSELSADHGALLIVDPQSGAIIAYAVYPQMDPNEYFMYPPEQRKNFGVVDPFEPGSTMKIVSAAAWLASGKADLTRRYHGSGSVEIAGATIHATAANGWITMADAVRLSDNVAVVRAMQEVPASLMYSTLTKFGFGAKTASGIPGESSGMLSPVSQWSGLSKYSMSIGHEIAVTTLQMAAAYGAIVNGGVYFEPQIIDSIKSPEKSLRTFYPSSKGRIVTEKDSQILREMLHSVVAGGTGSKGMIEGYDAGGKTGTARKVGSGGTYTQNITVASFIGFAPFENPRIVVYVVLDEPKVTIGGGDAAAPVFSQVASRLLPYLGTGPRVIADTPAVNFERRVPFFDGVHMPDFTGADVADTARLLAVIQQRMNLRFALSGEGRVTAQTPDPGTVLNPKSSITIYFGQ